MNKTQKLCALALTVSAAMLLSFIESQLPSFAVVPGIKIGLANIAVVFALYRVGGKAAFAVSCVRVFLISQLFGSLVGMIYGLVGAALSLTVMIILKKYSPLSPVGVSVAGGVAHNIGQIAVACVLVGSTALLYYLPVLVISGTVAGVVIGVASGNLVKRLK